MVRMRPGSAAWRARTGCESVGDIKPLLSRFPKGDWRTKAARTPLDLDGARRARAVSRMVPTGEHPPDSGVVGRGGREARRALVRRSRARAWSRLWRSVGGRPPRSAARCYILQRRSISGAGAAPLRFARSFIRFHRDLRGPSSPRTPMARKLV